jgi:hypothetical protein
MKLLKLLVAGLSLALFVSCANAVSNESDTSKMIVMIEESFPQLDAKVKSAEIYIEYYNTSSANADKLKQSLEANKFSFDNVSYKKDINYQNTQYTATAKIKPIKEGYNIILRIDNSKGEVDGKYVFDDVFGHISGDVSFAMLVRTYDRSVESFFKMYDLKLRHKYGFAKDKNSGILAKDDDNFYYQWIVSYAVISDDPIVGWSIERLHDERKKANENKAGISKTISTLKESFPPLDAKVKSAETYIEYYNASSANADKLKQSLEAKKFSFDNVSYKKDITYQGARYTATAKIKPIEEGYNIILRIGNDNGEVDGKYVFDDVFGYINGKVSFVMLARFYDESAESSFESYKLKLRNKYGFAKNKNSGILVKNDSNFYYKWAVNYAAGSDDLMVGWSIERIPDERKRD